MSAPRKPTAAELATMRKAVDASGASGAVYNSGRGSTTWHRMMQRSVEAGWFTYTGIRYWITDAGRAALAAADSGK